VFRMASAASQIPQSQAHFSPPQIKFALAGLFLLSAVVWFSSRFLLSANFLPHWYCYVGNRRLVWTNVIADLLIGLSYVAISATLFWLVRRVGRDLPYSRFFWAFGLFIVSCGGTHFMEVVTIWKPVYWLSAAVKIVTATASAGTAVVLLVAADDIVEFVRSGRQAAERHGNEQFRALINAAPMAVVGSDLEGRITAWNPAAERLFGWTTREVLGRTVDMTPPERIAESGELREKTLSGKVTAGFETERLKRDGQRFPANISSAPVFTESGAISSTVRFIEDISERKRIETELREKTETLSTVTEALNLFLESGTWSAASQRLLTFAIQKTQSAYGFLGVVLGESVLRILAYDGITWDARINRELYEGKIRQHQEEGYFEVTHVGNLLGQVIAKGLTVIANSPSSDPRSGGLPPGHPPQSAFLGVPIFNGRETVGLIAVANRAGGYSTRETKYLRDLTHATGVLYDSYRQSLKRSALEQQHKALEAQVAQAQKMEVLGQLAGGVAHDFNNMLMVLGGCAELLDRSLAGDSASRSYLDQIQRTIEKAAAVTKQLLTFSRKQVLELEPMDLHEALTESEFMLPRLLGAGIELSFHHSAKKSWIVSNSSQIQQLVANLAINASDAMPEGGRLTISTRDAWSVPADGAGTAPIPGEWVVLEVSDTGCGMDEATRAQIFEPFFTTKPAGKGTGLGLASVYGFVRQGNGHIRVETQAGVGTRFEVFFPFVDAPLPATDKSLVPETADATPTATKGTTILVADDEASLRQAVVEILRSSGYTVYEGQTALDAADIAEKQVENLDILLTDVVMPGLRGPELARRVTQRHPEVRVIFMSGYAEDLPEAKLPPNSAFIQKPFRFATLLEQLKLVQRKV
jgi:two-component system cell cycle sensor histidine kinase/response regulator CckA